MKRLLTALVFLYANAAISATLVPIQLLNPAGSTAGKTIVSTGPTTAPAWGGVPVGGLAAIAANSVIANATNASAIPTAVTVTGCNGAAQALQWTNGTGFGCNSGIATSGANSNITSLGGLTTPLSVAQGGTGATAATGTGSVVLATSPTITTPTITGVTNGSSAAAGVVGEFICAQVTNGGSPTGCATNSNAPVGLTTGTPANVTSVSLTAGNWRVCGQIAYTANASTTVQQFVGWISLTSATLASPPNGGAFFSAFPIGTAGTSNQTFQVGCIRIPLTSTTTVFMSTQSSFSVSTLSAYGFLSAERTR